MARPPQAVRQQPAAGVPAKPARSAGRGQEAIRPGSTYSIPKYGSGIVVRREGDGDDAKLTVSFPGYGLKKLVEKYAGIKVDE